MNAGQWEVWTTDGTKYSFGSSGASRLWTCQGTEAWKLDTITDTAGNTIEIGYNTDFPQTESCTPPQRQWRESYPSVITYTTNIAASDTFGEFLVEFQTSDRVNAGAATSKLYETQKLDGIKLINADREVVREWRLTYVEAAAPDYPSGASKDVLLTRIRMYGVGGIPRPIQS